MNKNERLEDKKDDHQKFKELAALAQRGTLTKNERLELNRHLQICASCRQACDEYALIATEGMSFLAAAYGFARESRTWDDRPTRDKLLAQVRKQGREETRQELRQQELRQDVRQETRQSDAPASSRPAPQLVRRNPISVPRSLTLRWAALAASILLAVAVGAYHLGGHARMPQPQAQQPSAYASAAEIQSLVLDKKTSADLIASQNAQLSRLQTQVSTGQQEITRLRDALRAADARSATLTAANTSAGAQVQQLLQLRDKLSSQLRDAEQSYQIVQAELTNLRAEHDRVLLRTTSLESQIDELNASARDQDHRLRDDEQYLASDRDIRELMGARKLYIADVFDVDSGSRTRKPFGRVFYTESKSLIFYAFDLDRQPGVKNASAFQVWGQRDAESGEKNRATNLGILYMDSESNRRWVLRLDDPKQLAEIDAVFVTVEPQGGSQKPTGKPFLYALLRREANHP